MANLIVCLSNQHVSLVHWLRSARDSVPLKKKYFSCELRSSGIHLKLHLQPECNLFNFDLLHFMEPRTLTVEISLKKKKQTSNRRFRKLSFTTLKTIQIQEVQVICIVY